MSGLSFTVLAVTLAESNSYFEERGNETWTDADDDVKTQALRRAQDFIAGRYNQRWIEEFDNAAAPDQVKFAIFEGAYRELTTSGTLAPDLERGGRIQSLQAGSVGVTYMNGASSTTTFSVIDNLLRGLVYGGSVVRLARA